MMACMSQHCAEASPADSVPPTSPQNRVMPGKRLLRKRTAVTPQRDLTDGGQWRRGWV